MSVVSRPADPDVRIPDAVRRAALRSEQFYQSPTQPGEEGSEAPVETSTTEQNQDTDNGVGEGVNDKTQQTEPAPQKVDSQAAERSRQRVERAQARSRAKDETQRPQEEVSSEPEQVGKDQGQERREDAPDTWERQYTRMKGRFDHANQQLQNMQQQIAGLQNVIATMQQPSVQQEHTPTQTSTQASSQASSQQVQQVESMLTAEEREQYGDEFLNVVAKKAHEIVGPLRRELEDKIKRLDSQVGNVGQSVDQSAKERMLGVMDQQLPDWRDINNDPNFIQWLQLPDTYSGAIRHNLLREAFNRNDSARVAAFFNGFLAEEAATAPQGQPRVQGAPASPQERLQQPSKTPLETFASPGRAKSATATSPAEKPIFTRAQIAAFYTSIAAGKYEGREKEKDKLEAQIFSAQQEGRIRN